MILKNNKGAALLQVLLVTVVLAGMSAMLLRATLSRTMTVRQTRRNVSTQIMADSCMAEVNSLWAAKSVATFRSDFEGDARDGACLDDLFPPGHQHGVQLVRFHAGNDVIGVLKLRLEASIALEQFQVLCFEDIQCALEMSVDIRANKHGHRGWTNIVTQNLCQRRSLASLEGLELRRTHVGHLHLR